MAEDISDTSDMRNNLIEALSQSSDTSIRIMYRLITHHIDHTTGRYIKNLDKSIIQFLLDPIVQCCLAYHFKNEIWHMAEGILAVIFIQPTLDNFNAGDITICHEGLSGEAWKIREDVDEEFYNLVSMLVDECDRHIDINLPVSEAVNIFNDIPFDVYKYIKTVWLKEHQLAVKSVNKN